VTAPDLPALTNDLALLFWQEIDGEPIDEARRDRVNNAKLDDSDWWVIATELWPGWPGHSAYTLDDLQDFLTWLRDSPTWVQA
jgi:hypothetical protein